MTPYELWAEVHAKGNVLVDDCRFFGLLENVRLVDDDALSDGLARVEEHIQRFVDVIFVPSHGSDVRLLAAADRLKMALLCNACPPAMADVFETWRADEPAWDYAYVRCRLVEHWKSLRRDPEADISSAREAPLEPVVDAPEAMAADALPVAMTSVTNACPAVAPAADEAPSSSTAIDALVDSNAVDAMRAFHQMRQLDASVDHSADHATSSTEKGRPEKRSTDAAMTDPPGNHQHECKRRKQTLPQPQAAVGRLQQDSVATRVSPRQHLGALRALKSAASPSRRSSTISSSSCGAPFTEEEVEFLRAAQRCATESGATIFERGRAQGLFINRSVSSIQSKLGRMKAVDTSSI
ncbi:hypothetical protein, variant [Saprolegnia diclina VS20]|uniref:Uncharacterized protein n=1 Tax=Saprolegnia diclina (strain VS20) TaxID=1156394 RepID=T0RFX2_SAPDV|nr:hypothetical protein, variant [Saprolegnia diclina VS20]EQC31183.1 hypothetical protein, variant [Saprolegnia diclina VS20]|eukprot:XP_008615355.1 hypothetical protein, variant [Saprolegnia diclina VS20]